MMIRCWSKIPLPQSFRHHSVAAPLNQRSPALAWSTRLARLKRMSSHLDCKEMTRHLSDERESYSTASSVSRTSPIKLSRLKIWCPSRTTYSSTMRMHQNSQHLKRTHLCQYAPVPTQRSRVVKRPCCNIDMAENWSKISINAPSKLTCRNLILMKQQVARRRARNS